MQWAAVELLLVGSVEVLLGVGVDRARLEGRPGLVVGNCPAAVFAGPGVLCAWGHGGPILVELVLLLVQEVALLVCFSCEVCGETDLSADMII